MEYIKYRINQDSIQANKREKKKKTNEAKRKKWNNGDLAEWSSAAATVHCLPRPELFVACLAMLKPIKLMIWQENYGSSINFIAIIFFVSQSVDNNFNRNFVHQMWINIIKYFINNNKNMIRWKIVDLIMILCGVCVEVDNVCSVLFCSKHRFFSYGKFESFHRHMCAAVISWCCACVYTYIFKNQLIQTDILRCTHAHIHTHKLIN